MRIGQVSFAERAGGAERVAMELHQGFRDAGHEAVLLTPRPLPPGERAQGVIGIDIHAGRAAPLRALSQVDHRLARPWASLQRRRGYDDFHHPWTERLLDLLPWRPDVLLMHNLHGGWFDLRQLAPFSRQVPTFVTLHDAAWLTGGPHFPFLAEHWPERILARNRRRRRAALDAARLQVVTPSRWMRELISGSELETGTANTRLIPYGIDTSVFNPAGPVDARRELDVPDDRALVLGVALTGRGKWSHKDPETVIKAFTQSGAVGPMTCCFLGSAGEDRREGELSLVYREPVQDLKRLAAIYRSADVLVHAAHEDNFPNVVLEAQACGLPCVVTDRGGMPEQVIDGQTGVVVPAHDASAIAAAVSRLLQDKADRQRMSAAAAEHAALNFTRERMVRDYLGAFAEAIV